MIVPALPPGFFSRLLKKAASAIPKEPSGSTSGLSWGGSSAETAVSVWSVCCLSEASFRRDSERRERSSEAGSALILWLLSDQAESNRKAML